LGQEPSASERAREWRLPYVRLLDAAGGSVRSFEQIGRTYLPDGNSWTHVDIDLLNLVSVVSAVMGSVAGLPAVNACIAHWNVMVEGTAHLFPGGPPVVKAALGYDIDKEELGGSGVHVGISGSVDNLAVDEEGAIVQVRRFLSYLPPSVFEPAPRTEAADDPERRSDDLLSLVPRNRRRPFDARRLVELVVDEGSFFEIAPRYGRARVTGLARVDGFPVGVMANDPKAMGGATDVAAGDPEAKRAEIEARLQALASPFRTAEATGQDIVDPRDTRPLLVEFVHDAQRVLRTQLGPPAVPYRP
jgi:acetyl-CoA carboxylase carboxyltransferase component